MLFAGTRVVQDEPCRLYFTVGCTGRQAGAGRIPVLSEWWKAGSETVVLPYRDPLSRSTGCFKRLESRAPYLL